MAFWDGIGTALVSGIGSLIGGSQRNDAQAAQAAAANEFSAQQFATRYQTTVKDMQAAGLNPMLAYSQGGGSPPSGQQAQMQDVVTPAVQTGIQTRQIGLQAQMNSAQVANVEADTENKRAQADLIAAQAAASWASAGQSNANVEQINANVDKIKAETSNLGTEGQRLERVVQLLYWQINTERQRGFLTGEQRELTIEQRNQAIQTIKKLKSETDLLNLDVDAARKFDNFGREYKQYEPVIELLKSVIGRTGGLRR